MVESYTAQTGRRCWIDHSHPAGPSIAAHGRDKQTHGIVIPIDDESRSRAVEALIDYTGYRHPLSERNKCQVKQSPRNLL
jgi:hypothetical protein